MGRVTPSESAASRWRSPMTVHRLGSLSTPITYSCEGLVLVKSDSVGCMGQVQPLSTTRASRSLTPLLPLSRLWRPASSALAVDEGTVRRARALGAGGERRGCGVVRRKAEGESPGRAARSATRCPVRWHARTAERAAVWRRAGIRSALRKR
eukprot:621515-Pleurochrysis_carterae.AAC.1